MEGLTIVVPFYNGHGYLSRLLHSIPAEMPVIVVDDRSDSPPEVDAGAFPNVQVLSLAAKGYFAGAVNAGIAACAGDVLVMNQDSWLEGQGPLQMLAHERSRYALIGERITGLHPSFGEHGYVQGTFMFMRRDALDAVGLLNAQDYPLWGGTAEWQLRVARKGFKVLPLPHVQGFRHERKPGQRFGSSIAFWLKEHPDERERLIRTPPAVSVIVPCYNYGRYLADCIHSLIGGPTCLGDMPGQSLQSFEVIIVDDASTDNTPEIAQALADPWKGIRYYRLAQNVGTAQALNHGGNHAHGQYMTFLSADDMREPDSLEKLYRACQANPHSFAYDDVRIVTDGKRAQAWRMPEYDFEQLLTRNQVHAGIMMPRAAWLEVGGYPPVMHDGREDWAMNVALGRAGYCGVHVPECGYLYRREGQNRSLGNTSPAHHQYFLSKLQRLFPDLYGGDPGERPMACCGQKGQARTPASAAPRLASVPAPTFTPGAQGMLQLEYVGGQTGVSTYTGPATGVPYRFGGMRRIGWVDARDVGERGATGLLNMQRGGQFLFRRFTPIAALPAPEPAADPAFEAGQGAGQDAGHESEQENMKPRRRRKTGT